MENISLSCTQINEIIGTEITKKQLETYLSTEGINENRIPLKVLFKIHPLAKEKVDLIIESINNGSTRKAILGDKECTLKASISGWASIPALFMTDEMKSDIKIDLLLKRSRLVSQGLIKLRGGKYYELQHDVKTKSKKIKEGKTLFDF